MAVLAGRFREVTVTLETPQPLPENLPSTWLQPQLTDRVIHFIHSGYQDQASEIQLANIFPSARDITFDPMPLRQIFLAVAKSGRDRSSSQQDHTTAEGTAA